MTSRRDGINFMIIPSILALVFAILWLRARAAFNRCRRCKCVNADFPLPPSILVGIKGLEAA